MAPSNHSHAPPPPPEPETEQERPSLKPGIGLQGASLLVVACAAAVFLLQALREVFIPLVLSGLLFYALDPFVDWLGRHRMPRAIAAALALLLTIGVGGSLALVLRGQAFAVVDQLPAAAQKLRSELRASRRAPDDPLDKVEKAAREIEETAKVASGDAPPPRGVLRVQIEEPTIELGSYMWVGTMGLLSLTSQIVMVLFLSYFLLLSDHLFKLKLVQISDGLERKRNTVRILDDIAKQIERFLMVQILTSAIVGVATWLALTYIGLDQAGFWGFVAGVLNTVPYFGPLIVTFGLSSLAYVQFGELSMALTVAGVALVITTLEGWFLTPVLMSRVAAMNQVAVFVGLLFWGWVWGLPGLLLAVPMMMVLKAVADRTEGLQPVGRLLGE